MPNRPSLTLDGIEALRPYIDLWLRAAEMSLAHTRRWLSPAAPARELMLRGQSIASPPRRQRRQPTLAPLRARNAGEPPHILQPQMCRG